MQPVRRPSPDLPATTRPGRARPDRAGRAAPPGRAARGGGRGRATAPAPAALREACRPRTCTSRCSRRGATTNTARQTRSRRPRRRSAGSSRRGGAASGPGGRRRPAGTSRKVSSMTGKDPYFLATCRRLCALSRCCQSGVRSPGRRRGMSSARAAFSRKRAPNSAVPPSSPMIRSSTSSGSRTSCSVGGGASASGKWNAIPSSDQRTCASTPSDPAGGPRAASAHGACTRAPNGVRTQTRQSPISSRKRSTTIVRSEGTAPVACSCSRRKVMRFLAASSSSE